MLIYLLKFNEIKCISWGQAYYKIILSLNNEITPSVPGKKQLSLGKQVPQERPPTQQPLGNPVVEEC